jgi:hypothetical protein
MATNPTGALMLQQGVPLQLVRLFFASRNKCCSNDVSMRGLSFWMAGEQSECGICCGIKNPQCMFRDYKSFGNDITEFLSIAMNEYFVTILQSIDIQEWLLGTRAVAADDDVALSSQSGDSS